MKTYKFRILFVAICTSLLFVQCSDDDDNGNVILQETCDDGIQNQDEEGVDCGGTACVPCVTALDFSGNYSQEDIMGRPGINTVFGGSNAIKNNFNGSIVSGRSSFQAGFQERLEFYHDVYAASLGIDPADLDYETNILGLDAATFTTVLAQFDAIQVAPNAPTTYYDGTNALTGRNLSDDVIDISLTLMFGGMSGTRFDGNNGTPQLTSDGVDSGDRDFTLGFPYLETPNN
ncbi:uncharacterized protein DUF4331 [Ulvibacter sp. MAR_2010_11]|uniref:DUF4331 family protein n=1 Tax=Ulvibacter sp. MAR_2010_11 TaxID=1250229 RepID=UPI000C2B66AD|nr:DUF4331 family protein [Ulvibacter sp. MAR_2010_11]PKA83869.1 uncharacterized protein DUF4331 [Ulvibacter sp. MAR_2010_11]